jgi:transcriptional regulator with XRE-family HTH domain
MRAEIMMALQSYRAENGITQAELSRSLGISRGMVSRLENCDADLTKETVERIVRPTGRDIRFHPQESDWLQPPPPQSNRPGKAHSEPTRHNTSSRQ